MLSNRRTCDVCEVSKPLTARNYAQLRQGVFRYTCRHCLGLPWQTHGNKSKASSDVEDLTFAVDECTHPAVRVASQPGKYPMRGYCNACQRMLVRETIESNWTYHRDALPYGDSVVKQHLGTFGKKEQP